MLKDVSKIPGAKIGLLSGLGPLAGSDVLSKIFQYAAARYGAVEDTEYPDVVLYSRGLDSFDVQGTMSDKVVADLTVSLEELERHQPSVIGIACNTAHVCLPQLQARSHAPIINLPDATARQAAAHNGTFLLLSSATTRQTKLYDNALHAAHIRFNTVPEQVQTDIDNIINDVMAHHLAQAGKKMEKIIDQYAGRVDGIIAGCTELPIALDRCHTSNHIYVDSNSVLATALTDACYQRAV
jgi:aspartate/glutamate racemase